ncbi:MAG: type II secretion system GspH family protein [Acetatifactor sp.]|nr:type II secretion system GspH family protein [Acetatifactor sp.]
MIRKRMRGDNRGLTLIELICAVAILSIITATVSGAMIVATNSYRSGTTEAALQQEAQFTANTIESLIVDATNEVTFDGTVLKIRNTDYTYEITYNSGDKTLKYNQYSTNTPSNVIASDALLAEHVNKFVVDASEFNTARNITMTLDMQNNDRKISTNYSFTSRNDPNAGTPLLVTANINCLDYIVLEPLQEYTLSVSVVGPTNTSFTAELLPEEDNSIYASATVVPGGVKLNIGATEDGASDAMLRLKITTNARNSLGTAPLKEKIVEVRIRRILDIDLSSLNLVANGTESLKQGAEYTISAEPTGSNLNQEAGEFDRDYVEPRTIRWRFDAGSENWNDYIEVLDPPNSQGKDLHFKLKKTITGSSYVDIIAVAMHPEGTVGALQTNKTGGTYGVVEKSVRLKDNETVHANLFRGNDCEVKYPQNYEELIKEEYKENHSGNWDESYGYGGGYTGNSYIRYKSTDGTHTSPGYPNWTLALSMGGNNPDQVEYKSFDFEGMRYTLDYDLELLPSFKYIDKNNRQHYYPEAATPPAAADIDQKYITKMKVLGFSYQFEACKDAVGTRNLSSYLTAGGTGVGTERDPLTLVKQGEVEISFKNMVGAEATRGAVKDAFENRTKMYRKVGDGWDEVSIGKEFSYWSDDNRYWTEGKIKIYTQNAGLAGNDKYGLYKLVMTPTIQGPDGVETYADERTGRGIIYIDFQASR